MGVKYVKDFSFPSEFGFTGSARSPSMAKGGGMPKAAPKPKTTTPGGAVPRHMAAKAALGALALGRIQGALGAAKHKAPAGPQMPGGAPAAMPSMPPPPTPPMGAGGPPAPGGAPNMPQMRKGGHFKRRKKYDEGGQVDIDMPPGQNSGGEGPTLMRRTMGEYFSPIRQTTKADDLEFIRTDKEKSHKATADTGHAKGGHFIQGMHLKKGALHRELGVPEGQKIPAAKLSAAASGRYGKLAEKRAHTAQMLKGLRHGKRKG